MFANYYARATKSFKVPVTSVALKFRWREKYCIMSEEDKPSTSEQMEEDSKTTETNEPDESEKEAAAARVQATTTSIFKSMQKYEETALDRSKKYVFRDCGLVPQLHTIAEEGNGKGAEEKLRKRRSTSPLSFMEEDEPRPTTSRGYSSEMVVSEEHPEFSHVIPIDLHSAVQCPLCLLFFPPYQIEVHASTCMDPNI